MSKSWPSCRYRVLVARVSFVVEFLNCRLCHVMVLRGTQRSIPNRMYQDMQAHRMTYVSSSGAPQPPSDAMSSDPFAAKYPALAGTWSTPTAGGDSPGINPHSFILVPPSASIARRAAEGARSDVSAGIGAQPLPPSPLPEVGASSPFGMQPRSAPTHDSCGGDESPPPLLVWCGTS